jgi:hypothetical protein
MFGNIAQALQQIKSDVGKALEAVQIVQVCAALGHRWRQRELDPVSTVQGFPLQVLHGNTACSHVPHLLGKPNDLCMLVHERTGRRIVSPPCWQTR